MSGVLKNSIVVLVTHHLQYAQLADAVLVIDQGETLAYDTYEEIMNMIDHSSENLKYARMKEVLSEMLANLKNKEARAVFDVEDGSVDLVEEEDGVPGSVRASIDQDNVPLLGVENGGVLVLPNGDLADMEPDVASYLDAGLGSLYPASSQISLPSLHNLASFTSDTVQTPYHQDQFSPTETLPQETSVRLYTTSCPSVFPSDVTSVAYLSSIILFIIPSITPSITPSIIPSITPSITPSIIPPIIPSIMPSIIPSFPIIFS
jgi:hypothetical protein